MHKVNPQIAIFASGQGSNAEALMDAFERQEIPATLAMVLSNQASAPVIEKAKARGYAPCVVPHKGLSREEHEAQILDALSEAGINHVILAGYMRILTPHFLNAFKERCGGHILNIHPSLLPEFPGLHAVERQWEARVQNAGATVHLVTPAVDAGPIIAQDSLKVAGDESAKELGRRIREEVEHSLYPKAVRLFLEQLDAPGTTEDSP